MVDFRFCFCAGCSAGGWVLVVCFLLCWLILGCAMVDFRFAAFVLVVCWLL